MQRIVAAMLQALKQPQNGTEGDAFLALLQVRKERMNLDLQTLRMERELARYGGRLFCTFPAGVTIPVEAPSSNTPCCLWRPSMACLKPVPVD